MKNIKDARKGERTDMIEGLREVDMRRSGKMKDGEEKDERWRRGQPIEKYGKKNRKSETTIFYLNLTYEHQ